VLEVIEKNDILNNTIQMGEYLVSGFKSKLMNSDKVVEIRSKGLMLAIELNQDCSSLLKAALDKKLLLNITGQSIRLLPPLIINKDEADSIINTVCELIDTV
jgi:acetylornithine aminotransferase